MHQNAMMYAHTCTIRKVVKFALRDKFVSTVHTYMHTLFFFGVLYIVHQHYSK